MNDSVPLAAAALALLASLVALDVLTRPLAHEMASACNSVLDLDLMLTASKIRPFLQCLGARGRSLYLSFYLFDFVAFPVIYATFAYLVLSCVWRERRPALPTAVVVCDVLENASIVFLLVSFPAQSDFVEALVPWFLRLKWGTLAAIVVSVIAGLLSRWCRPLEHHENSNDAPRRKLE